MERNVLAAVALSILVLVLYQAFLAPPPEPPKPTPAPPPSASSQAAPPPAQSGAPKAGVLAEAPAAATDSTPGRDIVVENAAVRAVFTTKGGALKSWRLKRYHNESGQPLELVPEHVPPGTVRPFTLATDDQAASALLATATYTTDETGDGAHGFPQTLRFGYEDGTGLTAQKTFAFVADEPYVIGVTASVSQNGQPRPVVIEWGPALGNGVVQHSRSYNPPPQPIFFKDRKVTRVTAAKISQQAVQQGTFGFAGVDDHYFLSAIVEPKQPLKIEYRAIDMPVEGVADGAHFAAWSARFDSSPQEATYFLGPKDFDVLARVDRDLVRAIDFGIFSWLVVPLLRALKWVNGYVGNYGWSLVILTVLINLAMFPLRHKSVVSMRKMQEIQPEVKAIQDRYAKLKMSDPARSKMNTEMMNLYRERGVNPASGCIPMLLTLPVLFAFYSLLAVAIELRGAPFVLWIHDLVAPDPYYVLPVLMGASMFLQQKMTPSTADPMQQRMMLVMPVVLSGMALWWSSGLLLYWTVSNVWGIGQQMITNRLIGPAQQRTVRPPAERRIKRAGSGKSDQAKERE
jgi:YidC/Oxa1 family membrane protein insertase